MLMVAIQHIPENVQCIFYYQHSSFIVGLCMGHPDRCRVAVVVSGGSGSSFDFTTC